MINIKENNINVEEFNFLYDEVKWGHYENKISLKSLENTFYSISVYEDNQIIGYGRIIGDTICFLYIQDIIVIPKYQNQKIGTMIMNKLLEKIKEVKNENPNVRVYLGASKGKEPFYEKFGFVRRSKLDLGEGMILNNNI